MIKEVEEGGEGWRSETERREKQLYYLDMEWSEFFRSRSQPLFTDSYIPNIILIPSNKIRSSYMTT